MVECDLDANVRNRMVVKHHESARWTAEVSSRRGITHQLSGVVFSTQVRHLADTQWS